MKIFVYTMVLSMLLFLLLLSFDEKRYQNEPIETNLMGAVFEQNISENRSNIIETPSQMNEQVQIQEAQQYNTTVWGLLVSTIQSGIEWVKKRIQSLYNQIVLYTKQSAYNIGNDIAELIYPPRNKNSKSSTKIVSQIEKPQSKFKISSDRKDKKEYDTIPTNIVHNR